MDIENYISKKIDMIRIERFDNKYQLCLLVLRKVSIYFVRLYIMFD